MLQSSNCISNLSFMQLFNLSFIKREQFLQQLHHLISLEPQMLNTFIKKKQCVSISCRLLYRFKCLRKIFLCIYFPTFYQVYSFFLLQHFSPKKFAPYVFKNKMSKEFIEEVDIGEIVGVSVNFFLNELHQHTHYFLLGGNLLVGLSVWRYLIRVMKTISRK